MKEANPANIKNSTLIKFVLGIIVIIVLFFLLAKSLTPNNQNNDINTIPVEGSTFLNTGDEILKDSLGKPYVILFSTTWCPHCIWIKDTFDSLASSELASQVNIQHWELDTGDNTLTPEVETSVPANIMAINSRYNPKGSVPIFVFGGKYIRVGNGYERQGDLNAETNDFKFIIGKLLV